MVNAIKTVGFQSLKSSDFTQVQMMLDKASEYLAQKIGTFDELSVTLKKVHETADESHALYEITANLIAGKPVAHAKVEDHKVLVAVDKALTVIKERCVHK